MTHRNVAMALLIASLLGFGSGVGLHMHEAHNTAIVRQLNNELGQIRAKLEDTTARLSVANNRLSFLEVAKNRVQVTAYALTYDFGPHPMFSNNTPARNAYQVPTHILPAGRLLNIALSPVAERMLHAHLNDVIVITSRKGAHRSVGRFVDRTAQTETRPVVDILFVDAHEARIWGRQSFYAVDISRPDSPFRQD